MKTAPKASISGIDRAPSKRIRFGDVAVLAISVVALAFCAWAVAYNVARAPKNIFDELLNTDIDTACSSMMSGMMGPGRSYAMDGFTKGEVLGAWLNPYKQKRLWEITEMHSHYHNKLAGNPAHSTIESSEYWYSSSAASDKNDGVKYSLVLRALASDVLSVEVSAWADDKARGVPDSRSNCSFTYSRTGKWLRVSSYGAYGAAAERYFYDTFLPVYFAGVGGKSAFSAGDLGEYEELRAGSAAEGES